MNREGIIVALERHWEHSGKDEDIAHEIYYDDAIPEFPQSPERFVGKGNLSSAG